MMPTHGSITEGLVLAQSALAEPVILPGLQLDSVGESLGNVGLWGWGGLGNSGGRHDQKGGNKEGERKMRNHQRLWWLILDFLGLVCLWSYTK